MKNPKIARNAQEELPVVNPTPDEAFWPDRLHNTRFARGHLSKIVPYVNEGVVS